MKIFNSYLKSIKPYAYTMAAIFILSSIFGYLSLFYYPEYSQLLEGALKEFEGFTELSQFQLFLFIFLNNSVKIFFTIVLGIFLAIVPVLMVFLNGYFIGGVIYLVLARSGWATILAGLLPHGIIEIPVFILAAGMGLMIGTRAAQKLFNTIERDKYSIKEDLKNGIRIFAVVFLPLLLAAALIESYITPVILARF